MRKVVVLSTGGTIASRRNERGASVASDDVDALLGRLPFDQDVAIEGREVLRVGGFLLTPDDMIGIVRRAHDALAEDDVAGVVVTHGTDTMEETAYLAELAHIAPRPVVFTGAQRSADEPDADGPRNLADAITVATSPQARGRGVLISFNGAVFGARGTRKSHTVAPDAFSAPNAGPIGQVRDRIVAFTASPVRFPPLELTGLELGAAARVDVVACYPGTDTAALDAVVSAGARGIVLETTGAGNSNPLICDAVARHTRAGVVVALSTRVHAGPIAGLYGNGGGVDLLEAGAVPTGMLRPSQARILLTTLLARYHDPAQVLEELARRTETPFGIRAEPSLSERK